jgi:hypothetical protein
MIRQQGVKRRKWMRFCIFLLTAGLLDAVSTQIGIGLGVIKEGNPIMEFAINKSWIIFYFIKIVLPLVLIGLFYLAPFKGKLRILLVTTCVLYLSVLCYHLYWIYLYLNTSA